ncbi:MAG: DUF6691 family protein [Methylophilaceae bacterium]
MSSKHTSNLSVLTFALLSGIIFGFGLILAGMANPAKVLAFLDLAGLWDPSLAFVMGGAILVGLVSFTIAKKRTLSLLGLQMNLPSNKTIDKRLVFGGLIFGIGWGLAGICPGPALVLLGTGSTKAVIFVIAMLIGMSLFELWENQTHQKK